MLSQSLITCRVLSTLYDSVLLRRPSKPVSGSHSRFCAMQAMATCSSLRPSVDISVGDENSEEGVGVGGARTEYRSLVASA